MIFIVCERDLETYEKKINKIGRENTILHTEFGRVGGCFWMRLDCED